MVTKVYEVAVGHTRFRPVRRTFRHQVTYWVTDLDALPRPPFGLAWLASFDTRDHFDDPTRSIAENAIRVLADHGIEIGDGHIRMLAAPRVLGYAFNPISVFWCYDAADDLVAVIAEVHNTYGGRHNYVLDTSVRARVDKSFYVSPFIEVAGRYTISAPEPGERVHVSIALTQQDSPIFSAWLNGAALSTRSPWRPLLRHPLASLRVSALIRRHGITLWLKRLPVIPRSASPERDRAGALR